MKAFRDMLPYVKTYVPIVAGTWLIVWSILEKKYGLLYVYAAIVLFLIGAYIWVKTVDMKKKR